MLVWLAEYLTQFHTGFNVFSYLTFRAIVGVLTAMLILMLWRFLRRVFRPRLRPERPERPALPAP